MIHLSFAAGGPPFTGSLLLTVRPTSKSLDDAHDQNRVYYSQIVSSVGDSGGDWASNGWDLLW